MVRPTPVNDLIQGHSGDEALVVDQAAHVSPTPEAAPAPEESGGDKHSAASTEDSDARKKRHKDREKRRKHRERKTSSSSHISEGCERAVPPANYGRKWDELPEDVQRKVEKLQLPADLVAQYPHLLYTICRFLMKSAFEGKKVRQASSPFAHSTAAKAARLRSRSYCTAEQIAYAKSVITSPPKPMKKLYKMAEKSGQGGFGTVMVAKELATKARVAIKKLPHDTVRVQENNWSEIAFLSRCSHANICKFHRAYVVSEKDAPELWIVMEFLEGGTLSEAARAHRFSDQHIAYVAHEVLTALKYLHGLRLVHRDLKSANVMMSIKGEIKLIDFGLCADVSEGPHLKMLGSPYWIPPEMVWEWTHSYAADIWSMAVCIIELYLANPPHPHSSIKCMFLACTRGLADQIPDKATPEARDFLTQCFTLDPEARPLPEQLLQCVNLVGFLTI